MDIIASGNSVNLKWYFTDATTGTDFTFDRTDIKVILYSCHYKTELSAVINGNCIEAVIPSNLPAGVYSLECRYWVGLGAKRANVLINQALQVTTNTELVTVGDELIITSVAVPIFTTKIATVEYVTDERYQELKELGALGKRTLYLVEEKNGAFVMYLADKSFQADVPVDEEDLTIAKKEDDASTEENEEGKVIRLKDRDTSKGKGYIILRTEKTLAEQMVQENTIYEIRYDFDLNGETLEVPANCLIEFKGGSFSNGTLEGNNTGVIANPTKIFGENLSVNGTWQIDHAYAEWFGAVADDSTDCYSAINKALSMNNSCRLLKGTYRVSNGIVLSNYMKLTGQKGNNTVVRPIQGSSMDAVVTIGSSDGSAASTHGCLRDLSVWASPNIGVKCAYGTQGFDVKNVDIKYCAGAGLFVSKCWYMSFSNINSWENKYGIELNGTEVQSGDTAVNGISFHKCWLNRNTTHSLYSNGHTTALSFIGCTFEGSEGASEIRFDAIYTDVTFVGCYMETYRVGFDINAAYAIGILNIHGGYYGFHSPTDSLIKLGTLYQFSCIGAMFNIDSATNMSGKSVIVSKASLNISSAKFPNSPNTWDATGQVINLLKYGTYSNNYAAADARSWQTRTLRVVDYEPVANGCNANIFIGKDKVNSYTSKAYGIVGLELAVTSTENPASDAVHLRVHQANGSVNGTTPVDIMKSNRYGDISFVGRVKGSLCSTSGSTANRPAWSIAHVGLIYFDTDLGKPIFMKDNGVWVDATGTQV